MNTSFKDVQKIVVAPQVVIYKNIFKHSKEIINLLQKDRPISFFTDWRDWYGQGYRKDADFKFLDTIDESKSKELQLEKQYITEVNQCLEFIRSDYFKEFDKNNGIWPSFIKSWEDLTSVKNKYWIDFFRYDSSKDQGSNSSGLMMEYHVDELPVPGEEKKRRHVATINFYLNDEYEGGEICVYDSVSNNSYIYKPSPGDAVIMPSTEPFYHGVKPFAKADRYFLRAFFDSDVANETEWKNKYKVVSNLEISNEESYVENDLQMIKLSIPENLIKVVG